MKKLTFLFVLGIVLGSYSQEPWVRAYKTTTDIGILAEVKFPSKDTGYVCGSNAFKGIVLRTVDAGVNWTKLPWDSLNRRPISNCFVNGNNGWVVTIDSGGIYHTANGGLNWECQYKEKYNLLFSKILFKDSLYGFAVGCRRVESSQMCVIFRTTDGGRHWIEFSPDNLDWIRDIFFINANKLIATSEKGVVFKSSDSGQTWNQVYALGTSLQSVFFNTQSSGWIVGYGGRMLHSADSGLSWEPILSMTTRDLYEVYFVDENYGWTVGVGGMILATNNGGISWKKQAGAGYEYLLSVCFTDTLHGYVTSWEGSIFRTETGAGGLVKVIKNVKTNSKKNLSIEKMQSSLVLKYDDNAFDWFTVYNLQGQQVYSTPSNGNQEMISYKSIASSNMIIICGYKANKLIQKIVYRL